MTSSAFFSMIRSKLRGASRWWIPVRDCKIAARRKNQSSNKRLKWEFQCNECKGWFKEADVSVDHTIECGSLNNFDDIPDFCRRLFVEIDGLQVMCDGCHNIKTQAFRAQLKLNKENNV